MTMLDASRGRARAASSTTRRSSTARSAAHGPLRQRAPRALGEALRPDGEGMVEARPIVLPRDRRRQLDELCLVELPAEGVEERVGHLDRRLRHLDRVVEYELLERRERGARPV